MHTNSRLVEQLIYLTSHISKVLCTKHLVTCVVFDIGIDCLIQHCRMCVASMADTRAGQEYFECT